VHYHGIRASKRKSQEDAYDEQQIEDVQSKLTMRYYHLGQDGPFATVRQPLSTRKWRHMLYLQGGLGLEITLQHNVMLLNDNYFRDTYFAWVFMATV